MMSRERGKRQDRRSQVIAFAREMGLPAGRHKMADVVAFARAASEFGKAAPEGTISHRKSGDFVKKGGKWVKMKGQAKGSKANQERKKKNKDIKGIADKLNSPIKADGSIDHDSIRKGNARRKAKRDAAKAAKDDKELKARVAKRTKAIAAAEAKKSSEDKSYLPTSDDPFKEGEAAFPGKGGSSKPAEKPKPQLRPDEDPEAFLPRSDDPFKEGEAAFPGTGKKKKRPKRK